MKKKLDRARAGAALLVAATVIAMSVDANAGDPVPGLPPSNGTQPDPQVFVDGPDTLPYTATEAVPPGYHLESHPRWGLVATGTALGSVLWVTSLVAAIKLDAEREQTFVDPQGGTRKDPAFSDHYTAMFIPIVGPFISIPTSHASGTGAAILALDGALQVGALAMAVGAFVAPKKELVKNRTITVTPLASGTSAGFALVGSM